MTTDTITEIVRADPARARIDRLIIEHRAGQGWTLKIIYRGLSRSNPSVPSSVGPYRVGVDSVALPDGVRLVAWEADEDALWSLGTIAAPLNETVMTAVGRLAESELLGSPLTVDRYDPASIDTIAHDPMPKWHVWGPIHVPTPSELRAWREREGLTQEQAARLADVARETWARWETGRREIPQMLSDTIRQRWGSAP